MDAKEAAPFDIRNGPDDDFLPSAPGGLHSNSVDEHAAAGLPAACARLPHSLRAGSRFVAALCLVSLSLLAVPMVAQAQTVTLVSNTGQTHAYNTFNRQRDAAQPFTTGTNASGYNLSSIEIPYTDLEGDSFSLAVYTVGADGFPDAVKHSLTAPGSFAVGTLVFTAPSNATLDANTTYAVVFDPVPLRGSGEDISISRTLSVAEDAGEAAGWSIADKYQFSDRSGNSGIWGTPPTLETPLLIAIKGSAIGGTITTTVPDAPEGLMATAGDGEVTLTWQAPTSDGGSAITSYEYRHAVGTTVDPRVEWEDAGAVKEKMISGLRNGTEYTFEVRAVNSAGKGAAASVTETLAAAVCTIDTSGRTPIWTGTVTVEDIETGGLPIIIVGDGHTGNVGDLSDKTFTRGTNNYEIRVAYVERASAFSTAGRLWFGGGGASLLPARTKRR